MELEDFLPDLPAFARKELGEGALMYQFKKHEHAELLLKHLATMQANEMLTDLTVRTKSKDLEEPFHSMLLAANSPVIRRSLTGKRFDCTSGVISLDLTKEQLGAFHDFLYKSELSTDQGMVNGFRQFATRYEMTYHEELCQERRAEREGHERMTVLSKDQKDVLSQLHDMCQKGELTTTCLEDCDGSSQFAVHSPLLAAASPVFQDIFLDDLLSQECSRYRLKNVTCNTLEDLIEFIYTGKVILEEGNVVDLLHAACDYEIPTLVRACCDWLKRKPASPAQTSCSAVTSSSCEGPLKKNGTPDMRFASNKQFSSSISSLSSYSSASGPLAKDGTPDMRCAANKSFHDSASSSGYWSADSSYSNWSLASLGCPGPLKSDGTPDMAYAANRSSYASPSLYIGSSFSVSSSSSSSRVCPLKSDGTPDMRHASNRGRCGVMTGKLQLLRRLFHVSLKNGI